MKICRAAIITSLHISIFIIIAIMVIVIAEVDIASLLSSSSSYL